MERGAGGEAGAEELTGEALMRARLDRAVAKRGGVKRFEQAAEDTRAGTGFTGGGKRKHDAAEVSIWLRTMPEDTPVDTVAEGRRHCSRSTLGPASCEKSSPGRTGTWKRMLRWVFYFIGAHTGHAAAEGRCTSYKTQQEYERSSEIIVTSTPYQYCATATDESRRVPRKRTFWLFPGMYCWWLHYCV